MRDAQHADLYGDDLAPWFHLLTPPEDYVEDAAFALGLMRQHIDGPLESMLELGSGGGNLASHLAGTLRLTLTDRSPAMLALSATLIPGAEHLVGDMRTMRLGRTFDAVLIHDAICYMTNETDLRAAMATAFDHLRPGGVAVLEPDYVRETLVAGTDHGGEDGPLSAEGRPGPALRYLEWVTDPDPTDSTYQVDYAILRRTADGAIDVSHDQRIEGIFGRATWLDLMADVGFAALAVEDREGRPVFVGTRPPVSPRSSSSSGEPAA